MMEVLEGIGCEMELNQFIKMLDAEYFAADALNHSGAKPFDKSSAYARWLATQPTEATEEMVEGSYLHALILAPETLTEYAVAPKIDKRTTAGKIEWAQWQANHVGKKVLTKAGRARAELMAGRLTTKPSVKKLLDATTQTEVAIFFERDGALCKAKLDAYTHNGIIWDIKSTQDASREGFGKSVQKFSYHSQAEWYLFGGNKVLTFDQFAFAAVESEGFTDAQVFFVPQHVLDEGRALNEERIEKYVSCKETGFYPGYPETFQELDFPAWGFKKRNGN